MSKSNINEKWKIKQNIKLIESILLTITMVTILIGVGFEWIPYSTFTHFIVFLITFSFFNNKN